MEKGKKGHDKDGFLDLTDILREDSKAKSFFRYGEEEGLEGKPVEINPWEDEDDDGDEGKEGKHFYKNVIYAKKDNYHEDKNQYDIAALDILKDTTHFTSQDWRSKNITIATQDPHLKKLMLQEKLQQLG